jgi:hypothetical protein
VSINKAVLLIGIVVMTNSTREERKRQGLADSCRSAYTIDDAPLVSDASKILAKQSSSTELMSTSSLPIPAQELQCNADTKAMCAAQLRRFRNTVCAANAFRSKVLMSELQDGSSSYPVNPSFSGVTSMISAPKMEQEMQAH